MTITLSRPFSADSNVDPQDTRTLKRVLNRLGYYRPDEGIGITPYPDRAVATALSAFQRDAGLPADGRVAPGDATLAALNRRIAEQPRGLRYTWRTVGDDRVRPEHAARDGKIFDWSNPPDGGHPGEAENCRCWAESQRCFDEDYKGAFESHVKKFEGLSRYPYLDSRGYITIGYGFNVHQFEVFVKLDLRTPDVNGVTASYEIKKRAHGRLTDRRNEILEKAKEKPDSDPYKSKPFQKLEAKKYEDLTDVEMTDETADAMLRKLIDKFEEQLKNILSEFECFPLPAKLALMDMIFNLGKGKFLQFQRLIDAARKRDWATAGEESRRRGVSDDRNRETKSLFDEAAEIEAKGSGH